MQDQGVHLLGWHSGPGFIFPETTQEHSRISMSGHAQLTQPQSPRAGPALAMYGFPACIYAYTSLYYFIES